MLFKDLGQLEQRALQLSWDTNFVHVTMRDKDIPAQVNVRSSYDVDGVKHTLLNYYAFEYSDPRGKYWIVKQELPFMLNLDDERCYLLKV